MSRRLSHAGVLAALLAGASSTLADGGLNATMVIDDRSRGGLTASAGGEWRLVTDRVMGGRSAAKLRSDRHLERDCLRLRGTVDTANNGGFVQMALELAGGKPFDASGYAGVYLEVAGNDEAYNLHLRTDDLWLPWQSYRTGFVAGREWRRIRLPFADFDGYRTGRRFDASRLLRIGLVAIGREFSADLCLGELGLYRRPAGLAE